MLGLGVFGVQGLGCRVSKVWSVGCPGLSVPSSVRASRALGFNAGAPETLNTPDRWTPNPKP